MDSLLRIKRYSTGCRHLHRTAAGTRTAQLQRILCDYIKLCNDIAFSRAWARSKSSYFLFMSSAMTRVQWKWKMVLPSFAQHNWRAFHNSFAASEKLYQMRIRCDALLQFFISCVPERISESGGPPTFEPFFRPNFWMRNVLFIIRTSCRCVNPCQHQHR